MRPKTDPARLERFAKNLKAALAANHLKQKELAARAGISNQAINHYFNGKHLPTFENAERLAELLNTDLKALGWY